MENLKTIIKSAIELKNSLFINTKPEKSYRKTIAEIINEFQTQYKFLLISDDEISPRKAMSFLFKDKLDCIIIYNYYPFCPINGVWIEIIMQKCVDCSLIYFCPMTNFYLYSKWFNDRKKHIESKNLKNNCLNKKILKSKNINPDFKITNNSKTQNQNEKTLESTFTRNTSIINDPISLKFIVIGYEQSKNNFVFDLKLNYKIISFIKNQTIIISSTTKSSEMCAMHLLRARNNQVKSEKDFNFEDQRLETLVKSGIAFYNSNIGEKDKKNIINLFKKKEIDVIVTTDAKINLKCDILIFKTTVEYRSGRFQEHKITEIISILSRVVENGKVYILTEKKKEFFYKTIFLKNKKIALKDIQHFDEENCKFSQIYRYSVIEEQMPEYILTFIFYDSIYSNDIKKRIKESFFYYQIGNRQDGFPLENLLDEIEHELEMGRYISVKFADSNTSKVDNAIIEQNMHLNQEKYNFDSVIRNQRHDIDDLSKYNDNLNSYNSQSNYDNIYDSPNSTKCNIEKIYIIKHKYVELFFMCDLSVESFTKISTVETTESALMDIISKLPEFQNLKTGISNAKLRKKSIISHIISNKNDINQLLIEKLEIWLKLCFETRKLTKYSLSAAAICVSKLNTSEKINSIITITVLDKIIRSSGFQILKINQSQISVQALKSNENILIIESTGICTYWEEFKEKISFNIDENLKSKIYIINLYNFNESIFLDWDKQDMNLNYNYHKLKTRKKTKMDNIEILEQDKYIGDYKLTLFTPKKIKLPDWFTD